MESMSGKNCGLAPWESQYWREKQAEERTHFTREQWRAKGRRVVVPDAEAVKVFQTKNGNSLRLYRLEQTDGIA